MEWWKKGWGAISGSGSNQIKSNRTRKGGRGNGKEKVEASNNPPSRAGGGDGRRLRGGREWNTGSRVRDLFIQSKHDFSHWIDDRWSIIVRPVGLKRA
jgi:hypothetical protein